jgi:hypothetical protein
MTDLDAVASPSRKPSPADLWHSYELAQQHYDSNIQLFSVRMNLFLLVQSALVAVAGNTVLGGKAEPFAGRTAISSFGLLLAIGWLLVASSSYCWVKTWRAHMIELGERIQAATGATVSSSLFAHGPRRRAFPKGMLSGLFERFSWFVRPTLVTCCLPVLFLAGWVYLGWYA